MVLVRSENHWSRPWFSETVATAATILSFVTGSVLGFLAATAGGWLDQVLAAQPDAAVLDVAPVAAGATAAALRAQFGPDALRHYIISHTEEASDLLEVLLLFKETDHGRDICRIILQVTIHRDEIWKLSRLDPRV